MSRCDSLIRSRMTLCCAQPTIVNSIKGYGASAFIAMAIKIATSITRIVNTRDPPQSNYRNRVVFVWGQHVLLIIFVVSEIIHIA